MATYKHLRSSTANKRPTTTIVDGQLAINTNTASPGLFFKDSAGTGIVKVGPVHVGTTAPNSVPASGGSSGNYTGEQWLDTSVSPAQMKVWNGSTWVGIVADELPVSKLQDGAARQLIQTDAVGTGVEWTSNVDVPGTLDVTSTATFDSIAQHPLGTAGAPTITFTGDTNTGLYSPGADQVAISTNGTGRLFVDASGRVGIGITPNQILNIETSAATPTVKIKTTTAGVGTYSQLLLSTANSFDEGQAYLRSVSANAGNNETSLTFGTSSTTGAAAERMRLDSSGGFQFKGAGTAGVTQAVSFNGSAPVNSLVIDSSGRLLVGTSSAIGSAGGGVNNLLQIANGNQVIGQYSANLNGGFLELTKSRNATAGSHTVVQANDQLGILRFSGSDGSAFIAGSEIRSEVDGTPGANDMPGRLIFGTTADGASGPTERMRISNTGETYVIASSGVLSISSVAAAGTSVPLVAGRHTGTIGTPGTGTLSVVIWSNGNVVNTNNSYGAISDIKLKENIVDANSQWDDLKALQVRNYNFKEGQTHTQIGLVAQEVELVSPGLVYESPDRDEDGNDLGTVTKSVNYSVLYMKAVKALQEAMERIEQLETEMAAVKAQLS
jgi:hypothetical protein